MKTKKSSVIAKTTKNIDKEAKYTKIKSMISGGITWYNIASWYLWANTFINKQQLYDMYRNNADLRQGIRKISQYVGLNGIKLKATDWTYPQEEEAKQEKDDVFFALSNPTYMNTKLEIIKHLIVSWELYILPTYSPVQENWQNVINGFQCLDPRTITPTIQNGRITEFVQANNIGSQATVKTYTADPENVTDTKPLLKYYVLEKHINNELRWMWLLEWIIRDAMSDLEASKRNYYFFENDMTPPSIFMMDPNLSEDEQEILLDQLKAQYSSPRNAHKPLMWIGVTDVKQLSISPKDMEHVAQRKLTTEKVCASIGLPKVLLWYVDNVNYANGQVLGAEFIEWTIRPREKFLEHIFNDIYETYMLDFVYQIEFHGMSAENTNEEIKIWLLELASWTLTIDEFRTKFDREPYAIAWYSDAPMTTKNTILLTDIWMDFTQTNLPT